MKLLAVSVVAALALAVPVHASPRKPLHCYWRDWSWSMLAPKYGLVVHCDRVWN